MKTSTKTVLLIILLALIIAVGFGVIRKQSQVQKEMAESEEQIYEVEEETLDTASSKKENTTEEERGRVQEEKVGEITGDLETIWLVGKEPKILTARDQYAVWKLDDASLDKEMPFPVKEGEIVKYGFLDEQGNIWTLIENENEKKYSAVQTAQADGGEMQRMELTFQDANAESFSNITVKKMYADTQYLYALIQDDINQKRNFYVFDRNGNQLYFEENIWEFVWVEDGKLLLHGKDRDSFVRELAVSDSGIENGENISLPYSGLATRIRYDAENDVLYLLLEQKIEKLSGLHGKKETSLLLDLQTNAWMISDSYNPADFWVAKDGSISVLYLVYGEEKIGKEIHRYVPYEATAGGEELVITLPCQIDIVDAAVAVYEQKYPDRHVKIEKAYQTEEEYLQYSSVYAEQMALRLMTGDYGDILLSGYGVFSMETLSTDAFLDLKDWYEKLPVAEEINANIIDAIIIDGALRGIPVALNNSYCVVNEDFFEQADVNEDDMLTWSEVLEQAILWEEEGTEDKYLLGQSPFDMTGMLASNIYDLVDLDKKTIDIRQDWFLDLIQKWKAVGETSHACLDTSFDPEEEHIFEVGLDQGAVLSFTSQAGRRNHGSLAKDALSFYEDEAKAGVRFKMIKGIAGEKNRNFTDFSKLFFSVNASSEKKEMALDFLEILLSKEVQGRLGYEFMPVNREACEARLEAAKKSGVPIDDQKLQEFYDTMQENLDQVDWLYSYSYYLNDLMTELERYVQDEVSLEEAITSAEEKMCLRMNE